MAQSTPPDPIFQLNDQLHRATTWGHLVSLSPERANPEDLRRGRDFRDLRDLLRKCQISHMDSSKKFWPSQLLWQIMTRERVKEELTSIEATLESGNMLWGYGIEWYLDHIVPKYELDSDVRNGARNGIEPDVQSPVANCKHFLKIFSILVLCENESVIKDFIEANISDDDLPLIPYDSNGKNASYNLALRSQPTKSLLCFRNWKVSEIEQFHDFQYNFLIPYFCLASDSEAPIKHAKYYPLTILPWTQEDKTKSTQGGYGTISCMRMHPTCHGFQDVPQVRAGDGMFALKMIITKDIKDFENETEMLRKFSGCHEHVIMLLMSFSWSGNNYLLFPWADSDLGEYWTKKLPPYDPSSQRMNPSSMEWISKQILGLTSGLHKIHNPTHLHSRSDMRFGRHGDLKPENIFWLKSEHDQDGILVIGDLGISALHRKISRSNQPGKDIPHSPDYRPPECDQEGGIISRAFDIWTLGCLLLEMVCWALGGKDYVNEFEADRAKTNYLGSRMNTSIFFDIKDLKPGGYVVLVKEAVSFRINMLHEHPGCTQYFHDLLDIIEGHMLVVLSESTERIRSNLLLERIEEMHSKVKQDAYGLLPRPEKNRIRTTPVGVVAKLNEHAMKRIASFRVVLDTYKGRTVISKSSLQMKEVD